MRQPNQPHHQRQVRIKTRRKTRRATKPSAIASADFFSEKYDVYRGINIMKKLFVTFVLSLVWVSGAWAHGDISKLPTSVQILQYELLLYMNPDSLETRNNLAMALYLTNKLEEAEKELTYVIGKDPQDFDALDGLGVVLIKKKKYQEALEYLDKAVKINEHDMMVHVHLSVAYEKMKLPEKAHSELEKARSLTSDPVELEKIEKELKLVGGE